MFFSYSTFFSFLAIFQVLQCVFLSLEVFQCFSSYSRTYIFQVNFSTLFSFLRTFQVIECLCLIFHVFQFPPHNPGTTVCFFFIYLVIYHFLPYSRSYSCVSHFPWFYIFMPYSRSSSVHFSFTRFFLVSCHTTGQTMFVSHFPCFFSFLTMIQGLECVFLIFHVFDCFWPYSRSYSVCVSFCNFLHFLAIIQVLHCVCIVSTFLTVSCHIPGPTVCVSHFPQFSFFSPYSRSYSVHFLFSPFLSVSRQFSLNSVCVSFPRFSIFSPYSRS